MIDWTNFVLYLDLHIERFLRQRPHYNLHQRHNWILQPNMWILLWLGKLNSCTYNHTAACIIVAVTCASAAVRLRCSALGCSGFFNSRLERSHCIKNRSTICLHMTVNQQLWISTQQPVAVQYVKTHVYSYCRLLLWYSQALLITVPRMCIVHADLDRTKPEAATP